MLSKTSNGSLNTEDSTSSRLAVEVTKHQVCILRLSCLALSLRLTCRFPRLEFLSMKPSTSRREAFFADFSSRAYRLLNNELDASTLPSPIPLITLTGGFKSRVGMHQALSSPVADLIGIGRPSAVDPQFARKLLDTTITDSEAKLPEYDTSQGTVLLRWIFSWMTLFGPSLDVFYHNLLMHSIAFGREPKGDEIDAVRARLSPFWTLARRNYLDPWISPSLQRLLVWSLVGMMSYGCLLQAGLFAN